MEQQRIREAQLWLGSRLEEYRRCGNLALLTSLERMSLDQVLAVYELCCGEYEAVFLTGAAGTGKSFVVKVVSDILRGEGIDVFRTASTGVAAQQVRGHTIHHLLGLRSFDVLPLGMEEEGEYKRASLRKRVKRSIYWDYAKQDKPHVIVIDEVSMLTSEQLVLVYQAVKVAREGRPFRFILVGDLRQLGPVRGKTFYPEHHHYCFEDAIFETNEGERRVYGSFFRRGPFPPGAEEPWRFRSLALYTPHRQAQANREFNQALFYLGRGEGLRHPLVSYLRERIFLPIGGGYRRNCLGEVIYPDVDLREATHLFMRNGNREKGGWHWWGTAGEYNERVCARLARAGRRSRTYEARIIPGRWSREELIDYFKPIPVRITLYEGIRFLCRHNYAPGMSNGTMCRVLELHEQSIVVEVIETGMRYSLCPTELPLPEHRERLGSFITCAFGQIGHGITYWASQGITLKRKPGSEYGEDCLVLHLERSRPVHGLFYVACSRVQTPEQLYIFADSEEQVDQAIFCDRRVLHLMEEAEAAMRAQTGERLELEGIVCRVRDSWETPDGPAFLLHTNHPQYQEVVFVYGQTQRLLTPRGQEIHASSEFLDSCRRAVEN